MVGTWTQWDPNFKAIHRRYSGHAAPAFLVSNLESTRPNIMPTVQKPRDVDTDGAKLAQAFSAANNEPRWQHPPSSIFTASQSCFNQTSWRLTERAN